jgi:hypothetical protein
MDKKKIQIIVIVICFVGTGGILFYGFGGSFGGGGDSSAPQPHGQGSKGLPVDANDGIPAARTAGSAAAVPRADKPAQYGVPAVFPDDTSLDLSVFDSAAFKNLTDYTPLTVSPEEIGRENPFN